MAERPPRDCAGPERVRSQVGGDLHPTPGTALLASAVAGAVLGAAGLAWWLLSLAERRRLAARQQRALALSRLQGGADPLEDSGGGRRPDAAERQPSGDDKDLHDKVHELNQAIEAVRRQLEQLQPQG
jgi:hypothetical protein